MEKKHEFKILFNGQAQYDRSFCYDYGSVKRIIISIAPGHAGISFSMNTKKSISDFIEFKVAPFKDAYSKCYLLHALQYSVGLEVKHIDIYIDGERTEIENNEVFPLLFSMIPSKELGLNAEWGSLCEKVVSMKKTGMNDDTRFSAVYAYLISKGKEFEIDRFQNLWTSMNAVYTYIARQYENGLREEIAPDSDGRLNKTVSMSGKDGSCIGIMAYQLGSPYKKINPEEARRLRNEYYSAQRVVCGLDSISLDDVYTNLYAGVLEDQNNIRNKYSDLFEVTSTFGESPFVFLILGYPYYWRCRYFHGNSVLPLFMAHNDDDLKVLRVMNYFLDRFLGDYIPRLFQDHFWTDENYRKALAYIQDCEPDACRKIQKADIIEKEKGKTN